MNPISVVAGGPGEALSAERPPTPVMLAAGMHTLLRSPVSSQVFRVPYTLHPTPYTIVASDLMRLRRAARGFCRLSEGLTCGFSCTQQQQQKVRHESPLFFAVD